MTATEELRRMLDERCVEWCSPSGLNSSYADRITFIGKAVVVSDIDGSELLRINFDGTPEQAVEVTLESEVDGEKSDGYHTFNELYHHRAVLFSVIVRDHRELAWKARKHHDGSMYDGMFIVGIETPKGQATYHYDLDPYWDMFDCEVRELAPEWDGHTPDEAIARIATLGRGTCHAANVAEYAWDDFECSECGWVTWSFIMEHEGCGTVQQPRYCPNCGRKVVDDG